MTDQLCAYHEAGHSVIALLLGSLPETVSIRPDGDSGGHTEYLPVESRQITKSIMFGNPEADRERHAVLHR
jgi:ATP-dependent Zn protease